MSRSHPISPLGLLAHFLGSQLRVEHVWEQAYQPPYEIPLEVVPTHRLILVRRGGLHYEVEGDSRFVEGGTMICTPAWSRRGWRVSEPSHLLWCEFSAEVMEDGFMGPYHAQPANFPVEVAALLRMKRTWQHAPSPGARETQLLLEGELKALLSRFLTRARPAMESPALATASSPVAPDSRPHPAIRDGLAWLRVNYARPDALAALQELASLSPSQFRANFRRAMQCSPGAYLLRLRMRRARYLLEATALTIKEVAAQVGFEDPLYFSRQFRKTWKMAPSELRPRES